jgi:phosphoesterase RecJ-like protein
MATAGRAEALSLIRAGRRFLVAGHRSPDADALGSALGLAAVLRAIGKEVVVFVPEPVPASLTFLVRGVTLASEIGVEARFDGTFVMDTAASTLLPPNLPAPDVRGPLVVVDHHAVHDDFGDIVVRELSAAATAEVVLGLARDLGLATLPGAAATPLYAALVADTGGFRYSNTSAGTLRQGAELVGAGADPWDVAYHLFEGYPRERLDLLAETLRTLELALDGRLATLRVSRRMIADAGATEDMVNGLVNYARGVHGVEVAVLLWEREPKLSERGRKTPVTRLSFRSRGDVDVGLVATHFGGGGHRNAAGAEVHMNLRETFMRVVSVVKETLGEP